MNEKFSLVSINKLIFVFFVAAVMIILPYEAFCSDSLRVKAHISWGWINDFEFYQDGIFITPYGGNGIGYFTIDSSYNLTHRYTVFPVPSASHMLVQCCIADSFLFALDGSFAHPVGEPVFFSYKITDSNYTFLAGLEPTGTVNPAGFDPIIYHNGNIIYSEYPQTFVRIDVTNPTNPYVTGELFNGDFDVCHAILPYEDTLLITSRQCGGAYWDGNFRLIKNNEPDTLISVGKYGTNRFSYTAGITNIGSVLFTAHNQGLVVYDISNFSNVHEIYFYSTAWARFIEQANNYVFMSCNDGWHVFKYESPSSIQHHQYLTNDERILWMKLRPEEEELWCFVDEGSLGGLVIFDISDFVGIEERKDFTEKTPESDMLKAYPNPFKEKVEIKFQMTEDRGQNSENRNNEYDISLLIFDVMGRKVREISLLPFNFSLGATWDGKDDFGKVLPSGIYYCRLSQGNRTETRKILFVK